LLILAPDGVRVMVAAILAAQGLRHAPDGTFDPAAACASGQKGRQWRQGPGRGESKFKIGIQFQIDLSRARRL
jgi:hypothetical protein